MKTAPERTRLAVAEPDRLEPFPAPRDVGRIFGQDAAIAEFEAAQTSGRMHHAWLLVGPEGVGKATLAYRFARTVLAGADTGDDVSVDDPVFRKVAGLSHPNLLVIRRSWIERTKRYSQWISVDEVRRLQAFLGNTAAEGEWRVVIIDRADDLNQNAANALLKALEEPPPNTLFFLISSSEGRLPITIRSRTRTLRVPALAPEPLAAAVEAALTAGDVDADDNALAQAYALSQGSVRRALELVSGDGIELYTDIVANAAALPDLDGKVLHRQAERLSAAGETARLELYFSLLLGFMERLIRFGATGRGLDATEAKLAKSLVSTTNLAPWSEAWEALSRARDEAFTLNLDRNLLVLNTWSRLQQLTRDHPA